MLKPTKQQQWAKMVKLPLEKIMFLAPDLLV